MLASRSRRSPQGLKLEPLHINLDQRRWAEFVSEVVNRCRSNGSAINPRPGFRDVGSSGLTDDRDVVEPVESSLPLNIGGVGWVRLKRDNQSRCPDRTSANKTVEADMGTNVKERIARGETFGNRPLDHWFERPEPILSHDIASGAPPPQAPRLAQADHRNASFTMER